jgi:hypothetical protein
VSQRHGDENLLQGLAHAPALPSVIGSLLLDECKSRLQRDPLF